MILIIAMTAMTAEVLNILTRYGQSTVQKIQDNLRRTGTDASGGTSGSLHFEIIQRGDTAELKIVGRPFFMTVETGRGPTKKGAPTVSPTLVEQIQIWMFEKGVDGSAFAIAKSIHKHGTQLFQSGGRKDIVSNVINESLTTKIEKDILKAYADLYVKSVINAGNNR